MTVAAADATYEHADTLAGGEWWDDWAEIHFHTLVRGINLHSKCHFTLVLLPVRS